MTTPTVHIYGQGAWHDDIYIVGDKDGLKQLLRAVACAIHKGEGEADVFAGDGEGYTIRAAQVEPDRTALLRTPYTDEIAADPRPNCIQPWKL